MGNRDFRVEAPRMSRRERMNRYRQLVDRQLVSLKGLWPVPSDYAGLRHSLGKDLLAGVTVAVVALPLALGFGAASGAGAAAGLVTAIVAGIVAAVFGGSHLQVTGPTGAMTVVLLPVIAAHGVAIIPLLAVMAGVLVVLMAVFSMGRAVDFLSFSVVEGFTMGIGVIIMLQQLPLVLGTARVDADSTLVSSWLTLQQVDWSRAWVPLAVAAVVVLLHIIGGRLWPKLPIALVTIVLATVAVEALALDVDRIGALPTGLPAPSIPYFDLALIQSLAAPAIAVAVLAALESLLSARVADGMRPDVPNTHADRELMGQGLANIASGLFGGLPATGAIARTAMNVRSGAHTRLSAVVHGVVLLLVMLLLAPIVGMIPMAALGGVLLVTAARMISPHMIRNISRVTRADRNTFWMTFVATVAFDLIVAVLVGLAVAGAMSIRHMAEYTAVARQKLPAHNTREGWVDFPEDKAHLREHVAVYRVDGALFYGNARRFTEIVAGVEEGIGAVILRCHRLQVLDASGAHALQDVRRQLRRRSIPIVVQGMNESQLEICRRMEALPEDHLVEDLSEAIDWVIERLEPPAERAGGADATLPE